MVDREMEMWMESGQGQPLTALDDGVVVGLGGGRAG